MAKKQSPAPANTAHVLTNHFVARIVGQHSPLHVLLPQAAAALAARGVYLRQQPSDPLDDYAQIDPSLARIPSDALPPQPFGGGPGPADGLGYRGFDAEARTRFLEWLNAPEHDAPASFYTLFLAYAESTLMQAMVEQSSWLVEQVIASLRTLEAWPPWRRNEQRARTLLLAYLLLGDGGRIAAWLSEGAPTPRIAGLALGQQAMLGAALTPAELLALAHLWGITDQKLDEGVVALRLRSLADSLQAEPLAYALRAAAPPTQPMVEAGAAAIAAAANVLPWRCAHRDLRLAFAQVDIEAQLAPLLAEMLDDVPLAHAPVAPAAETEVAPAENAPWTLILEFGHSRSEYFEFALRQAQRLGGYSALVDEQRHVVHRVTLKKSEMRRFWQLWEYAQNWSDTHVYVNGVEMEKWKIYPYSQFLT